MNQIFKIKGTYRKGRGDEIIKQEWQILDEIYQKAAKKFRDDNINYPLRLQIQTQVSEYFAKNKEYRPYYEIEIKGLEMKKIE